IEIAPARSPVRWLGVIFDPKLSFRDHVETWGAKATKVAAHLRGLSRVNDGAPPWAIAKAAQACVIPVLTYGTETWWKGKSKPSDKEASAQVSTRQAHLSEIL
ncbi:hypothetical protein BD289DRAFT_343640, partial [Coniella lustricola]